MSIVYMFGFESPEIGGYVGLAVSSSGVMLASMQGATLDELKETLGSPESTKRYDLFFENSYSLEWVVDPENHKGLEAAQKLNHAEARAHKQKQQAELLEAAQAAADAVEEEEDGTEND